MKKLEKILAILILVFFILKLMFVPLSGALLSVSSLLLALIYYPLGFAFFNNIRLRNIFRKESYKGISAIHIIGAIFAGMALSEVCVGVLFKIMRYPLADTMLVTGLIATFIILIIALIRYLRSKSSWYTFIFKRIAITGLAGILFLVVSELTLVKIEFRNHPGYVKAFKEYKSAPATQESEEKLKMEYMRATMSDEDFQKYSKYCGADSVK